MSKNQFYTTRIQRLNIEPNRGILISVAQFTLHLHNLIQETTNITWNTSYYSYHQSKWTLSNDITRWIIETNSQTSFLLTSTSSLWTPKLCWFLPHNLRINTTLMIHHTSIIHMNVKLFLLHPLLHRFARCHGRCGTRPKLVTTVLAGC